MSGTRYIDELVWRQTNDVGLLQIYERRDNELESFVKIRNEIRR